MFVYVKKRVTQLLMDLRLIKELRFEITNSRQKYHPGTFKAVHRMYIQKTLQPVTEIVIPGAESSSSIIMHTNTTQQLSTGSDEYCVQFILQRK